MRTLLLVFVLFLSGCASFNGRGLVAGQSTAKEVEALMGAPAERITLAGGDSLWFYPRQPVGRETYAVRLAPDGVLRSVEQVLTEENLKKISAGTTTSKEVRALLGPPWLVSRNDRMQREVWQYNIYNVAQWDYFLYVQMSAGDGIVREVMMVKDYVKESGHKD